MPGQKRVVALTEEAWGATGLSPDYTPTAGGGGDELQLSGEGEWARFDVDDQVALLDRLHEEPDRGGPGGAGPGGGRPPSCQ